MSTSSCNRTAFAKKAWPEPFLQVNSFELEATGGHNRVAPLPGVAGGASVTVTEGSVPSAAAAVAFFAASLALLISALRASSDALLSFSYLQGQPNREGGGDKHHSLRPLLCTAPLGTWRGRHTPTYRSCSSHHTCMLAGFFVVRSRRGHTTAVALRRV